jgi:membrane-bound metal-dependent hydrolase YbcI (DUF457 family)
MSGEAVPSPVGHALGAVAAGWLVAGGRPSWRSTATFAAVGLAPDLDLLVGSHSTYTHSVGAVAIVTAIVWAISRDLRWALAIGAAWASHVLLDWLGSDTSYPIGIMALWPFSPAHYQSSLYLFDAISRRYWLPEQFFWGNLRAAVKEVAILLPIATAVWWTRARGNQRTRHS